MRIENKRTLVLFFATASATLLNNFRNICSQLDSLDDMILMNFFLICCVLIENSRMVSNRSVWVYERNQHYFSDLFHAYHMDHFFKQHFRLNKTSFVRLCQLVEPRMERETTHLRAPVPLPLRVAIGLRRLGKGNSFESLGIEFGVGESTAHAICAEFEEILCEKLPEFIKFPTTEEEVRAAISKFQEEFRVPQIVGAIDGSHFKIKAPGTNKEDYYNRKQFYSVNMQGIVDPTLKYLDISVGYPGSIHDSRVLSLSPIFDSISKKKVLMRPTKLLMGVNVGPLLLGDSAYPLSSFLVTPFNRKRKMTETQKAFNKKFCGMRSVVERGFGLTKNRWRITDKKNEQTLPNAIRSITAACVLHNFCLLNQDGGDEFMQGPDAVNENQCPTVMNTDGNGTDIRNALMDHMMEQGLI